LSDAERKAVKLRDTMTGGAGGIVKGREEHVAKLSATIGGVPVTFVNVPIEPHAGKTGARLGMDYVAQLSSLTLDFAAMRVLAVPRSVTPTVGSLDFLAGDWVLSDPNGKQVGTSHVTLDLSDAVVREVRHDAQGVLPVWFVRTEQNQGGWSQLFPGPRGMLREFTPVSGPGEWPLILGGEALLTDGRLARFRLTLTHDSAVASHRLLQMSTDGGQTWQVIFDYFYRRVGAAPRAPERSAH
jgi:hypothetical protein